MSDTVKRRLETLLIWVPGGLILLPLGALLVFSLGGSFELFRHLLENVLAYVSLNTALLCGLVTLLTLAVAIPSAWFVTHFKFPGRSFLSWALALPLAIPGYIVGFVWIGVFDFSGPVQSYMRGVWPEASNYFPRVRSLGGAALALSLSLYPYVYILARNGFESAGGSALEVARSLGCSLKRSLFRVSIPGAAPWIASGLALVLFETLADFGTVSVFNVDTFTTAIFRTWHSLQSLEGAAQLALIHLVFVTIFVALVTKSLVRGRYTERYAGQRSQRRMPLAPLAGTGVCLALLTLFGFAFVLPVGQLLAWSWATSFHWFDDTLSQRLLNSASIATLVGFLILLVALGMAFLRRVLKSRFPEPALRLASLGYGMPGTVLAVALMILLTKIFGSLYAIAGLSLSALVLGLSMRYFTVGYRPVETGFERLSPQFEEASRSLGLSRRRTFRQIHFPLLRRAALSGFVLVFIDVVKEMPMTVLFKPWGWETLSVRVYQFTSEGMWAEAAAPALVIVAVACLPTLWIGKRGRV